MATSIETALKNLGNYRVKRAQEVAAQGEPDGISGVLLLCLGLRETNLRNIEGGAKQVNGKWVPLDPKNPDDVNRMDVGWVQINRGFHHDQLRAFPGVKSGTWGPVVPDVSPATPGFVPRFEESLQFVIRELHEAIAYAEDHEVPEKERVRFAIAAHNAGLGGALRGFKEGNVDKYTANGDYSEWVIGKKSEVNRWLNDHPNWKA